MNAMTDFANVPTETCLLEVLTSPSGNTILGYRVGGVIPGPSLLVAGHDPVAGTVYDRLIALPSLGRVRGSLTLIYLNLMEREGMNAHFGKLIDPKPDDIAFLPYHLAPEFHDDAATEGYWSVLRKCKQLGMISGRGLPYDASQAKADKPIRPLCQDL